MRKNSEIIERLHGYTMVYNNAKDIHYAAQRRLMYKINELRWVLQIPPLNESEQWRKPKK